MNWTHNYLKKGPDSAGNYEAIHDAAGELASALPLIYSEGNLGIKRNSQLDPQWAVGVGWTSVLLDTSYRRTTKWPVAPVTTTVMSYAEALNILSDVGATRPVRDSIDARVISDFDAGTGAIIDNVVWPTDFPTFQNITPPTDSDNDAMADTWENARGLNTSVNDSALDDDSDGYTNIEEYLHYLAGNAGQGDTTPPASPTGVTVE